MMTIIEELFGKGTKLKQLTKEQRVKLDLHYKKRMYEKMSDEERSAYHQRHMKKYRENHHEKYKEYQRKYRQKRRAEDPEFKERTDRIGREYEKRRKHRKYAE